MNGVGNLEGVGSKFDNGQKKKTNELRPKWHGDMKNVPPYIMRAPMDENI